MNNKENMARRFLFLLAFSLMFPFLSPHLFASMSPEEVEKIKEKAPLHVIGKVVGERFHEEVDDESREYHQIRKFTLSVRQVKKGPDWIENGDWLEVYYTYVPSWLADEYVGLNRVDIVENDVIEIWLEPGEYGWESASSGYTVKHIYKVQRFTEPVPEPFWHKTKRNVKAVFIDKIENTVFLLFVILVATAIFVGIRKK
ncbi:MAG: hypothetical protein H0Z32_04890 [Bacillaceae bacterium]|nr:hypothetical protein [Bacillaceae bacterium]